MYKEILPNLYAVANVESIFEAIDRMGRGVQYEDQTDLPNPDEICAAIEKTLDKHPELEPVFADYILKDGDVYMLVYYAMQIKHKRWKEAEPIIQKNSGPHHMWEWYKKQFAELE